MSAADEDGSDYGEEERDEKPNPRVSKLIHASEAFKASVFIIIGTMTAVITKAGCFWRSN